MDQRPDSAPASADERPARLRHQRERVLFCRIPWELKRRLIDLALAQRASLNTVCIAALCQAVNLEPPPVPAHGAKRYHDR